MSEQLKPARQIWAEKKRHGSKDERLAAVSKQTARILDKLLERSRNNIDRSSVNTPSNAITTTKRFEGATVGSNRAKSQESRQWYHAEGLGEQTGHAVEIGAEDRTVKSPLRRKEKTEKSASISRNDSKLFGSGNGKDSTYELVIDPEGKKKPVAHTTDTYRNNSGTHRYEGKHTPSAEEVIGVAAPLLYEMKTNIDESRPEVESRKAA